ncbi:MAG: hypothetical protein K2V38_12540 [Gemmataceae bacterium]|nr:hypothetical protein [Gemmataceae bacterium]
MRNSNDGTDARRGWDDLPPRVRARVRPDSPPPAHSADAPSSPGTSHETDESTHEPAPFVTAAELARDLSRLALLFSAVAVGNVLFLVLVVKFLFGN